MDEILFELREHSSGLNCGRWDYIFSFIKKFRNDPKCVMPDRARVGMTEHFLRSYSLLLIQTCHRRGAHAMGGMAAQIPIKNDPERNRAAIAKVEADKRREAGDGHDGTWVAHPGLVATARAMFDEAMHGPNQLDRLRGDVAVTAEDLLRVPSGPITEEGLRMNVRVGVQYLAAWLSGSGCVPLYDLMEDAATAEISRAQVWQWIRHGARLDDGRTVDAKLLGKIGDEELERIRVAGGEKDFAPGRLTLAAQMFTELSTAREFSEFLTLPLYDYLLSTSN
jgi:malate synthase